MTAAEDAIRAHVDAERAKHKTNGAGPHAKAHTGLSPSDVIDQWKKQGPIERLATGWATFDADSRGGLIFGHATFILGAPNAKKTAALACLADRWLRDGVAIGAYLVDEDPTDFLIRFAVRAGFSLDDCESRRPEILDAVREAIRDLPLRMYGSEWTIEAAAADFAGFAGSHKRAAFLIDTIQTVTSDAAIRAESPRALVSANVLAAKAVADSRRWAVVATSEMNRNAYRSEDASERSNDMAAGKESGAIEYQAKAQLVFRSVKGDGGLVQVKGPKIKRGATDETEFYLRFDRERHTLVECATPAKTHDDEQREESSRAKGTRKVKADAKVLQDIVVRQQGVGERELRAELLRQGHTWGRDRLHAAKREMGPSLVNRGTNTRDVQWHVVAVNDGRSVDHDD